MPDEFAPPDSTSNPQEELRKEFAGLHAELDENVVPSKKKRTFPPGMILEAYAGLEPGLILSHEDLAHIGRAGGSKVMERIVHRLRTLIASAPLQEILRLVEPIDKNAPDPAGRVQSEDRYALQWTMDGIEEPPLSKEHIELLPTWMIGALGTEARCAIAEVCAELEIPIYGNHETNSPLGAMLAMVNAGKRPQTQNADQYNHGPIDPEKDLPPGTLRIVSDPSKLRSLEDVIGLDEAKERLAPSILRLAHPELVTTPTQHVLLVGPHGVGKTLLAEAMARNVLERQSSMANPVKFVQVNLPNVFWKWVGESNANTNRLLQFLEQNAPIIAFMDEIEAALSDPSHAQMHEETLRVQNTILQWMSGLEQRRDILIIGATNRPEMIHPGFIRGGRFGRSIAIPYPTAQDLQQMLRLRLAKFQATVSCSEGVLQELLSGHGFPACAEEDAFTGADIDLWCANMEDALLMAADRQTGSPLQINDDVVRQSHRRVLLDRVTRKEKIAAASQGGSCDMHSPIGAMFRALQGGHVGEPGAPSASSP